MIFSMKKKVRRWREKKTAAREATVDAPLPSERTVKPEWKRALTESMEQNCIAPSDDAVLHARDLYIAPIYTPCLNREHEMADLFAEIVAKIAALHALVPQLIERAMSRHPFEFTHMREQKEVR